MQLLSVMSESASTREIIRAGIALLSYVAEGNDALPDTSVDNDNNMYVYVMCTHSVTVVILCGQE